MTLRPVGIAILNSSHGASAPSPFSYSSSSSTASISKQERPYAITRNQTSNPDGNNSHTELLIIASQQPTNADIFNSHINGNNSDGVTSVRYITSNYSANASAPLPSQSTIYNANISGPIPSQGTRNENLQDSIDNNNNNNNNNNNYDNYAGNSSIYNIQQPALSPTLDTLVEYPDGQLGKARSGSCTSRTIIFLFLFLFLFSFFYFY